MEEKTKRFDKQFEYICQDCGGKYEEQKNYVGIFNFCSRCLSKHLRKKYEKQN